MVTAMKDEPVIFRKGSNSSHRVHVCVPISWTRQQAIAFSIPYIGTPTGCRWKRNHREVDVLCPDRQGWKHYYIVAQKGKGNQL